MFRDTLSDFTANQPQANGVHVSICRALGQPNPGIAAEDAARGRKQLGLFS
jgi:hypothetical protein